ncbi:MAG TPA: glycosyltransferase [Candidatus Binataceae bacterium]|jgi:glycosyltransferase involved in cell wall biosynthesis|nr:glycosyltransferase [Candidatus Binataceae bacterium]
MVRVSAIIPAYNGAATVAEAIDSALAQTCTALEVIVVNDGSTDGTAEVLRRYSDRIRVIDQLNGGIAKARNTGAAAACGEYLAFLDCDDVWMPAMVERAVAALDADPGCVLSYCNCAVMDSEGQDLRSALVGEGVDHAPTLAEMLSRLWPIMPSAVVLRRTTYEECGGFAEEFRSYGFEDVIFWLRVRERGHFYYVPEKLVRWRFALFPRPLKIGWIKPEAFATFDRILRERYHVGASHLMKSRGRASRSLLGYIGLRALDRGDRVEAREAFRRALEFDPWRMKNLLRYAKTYLPPSLARALTGRTRDAS